MIPEEGFFRASLALHRDFEMHDGGVTCSCGHQVLGNPRYALAIWRAHVLWRLLVAHTHESNEELPGGPLATPSSSA